ncbi:hypothetical protein GCM10020367_64130 [Streptomyces sannanensis]|uniref:Uncharacterized protein n=1 Tax=Streptomyces sannanensis TaxID=285536 RepID=A0ABP6SLV4_9ACTN
MSSTTTGCWTWTIGAPPARVEPATSFRVLLWDAPTMRLAAEPDWGRGFVIRGPKELLVEL